MYWMRGIFTTVILYISSERGLGARDLEKGRRGMDLERCADTIWQLFLVYCMTQRRGRFSFFFRLWDEKSKILRRLLCGINKMGLGVWHVQDSMVVWQRLTETSWKCRLKCHWAVEGVLYCIIARTVYCIWKRDDIFSISINIPSTVYVISVAGVVQ